MKIGCTLSEISTSISKELLCRSYSDFSDKLPKNLLRSLITASQMCRIKALPWFLAPQVPGGWTFCHLPILYKQLRNDKGLRMEENFLERKEMLFKSALECPSEMKTRHRGIFFLNIAAPKTWLGRPCEVKMASQVI